MDVKESLNLAEQFYAILETGWSVMVEQPNHLIVKLSALLDTKRIFDPLDFNNSGKAILIDIDGDGSNSFIFIKCVDGHTVLAKITLNIRQHDDEFHLNDKPSTNDINKMAEMFRLLKS